MSAAVEQPQIHGGIHQMRVIYDPEVDRLRLQVNTKTNQEFTFWLTRRFVDMFWHGLQQTLDQSPAYRGLEIEEARTLVMASARSEAVQAADYNTPYQGDDLESIFGDEGILIHTLTCGVSADGQNFQMGFSAKDGRGATFSFNAETVFNLLELIARASRNANWGLEFHTQPAGLVIPETKGVVH